MAVAVEATPRQVRETNPSKSASMILDVRNEHVLVIDCDLHVANIL